jgi:DNA-binding beta-propeller fold protein YncE
VNGLLAVVDAGNNFLLYNPSKETVLYTVIEGARGMWDITANAAGNLFFIADYFNVVWVVDQTVSIVDSVNYSNLYNHGLPASSDGPTIVALSPDEELLYVANFYTNVDSGDDLMIFDVSPEGALTFSTNVYLQDSSDPSMIANLYDSVGMVVTSDGSEVWVADDRGERVVVYDTINKEVTAVVLETGSRHPEPVALTLSPDESIVYATGSDSRDWGINGTDLIYAVDTATKSVLDTIRTLSVSLPGTRTHPMGILSY